MSISRRKVCETNDGTNGTFDKHYAVQLYNFHLPQSLKKNAEQLCWSIISCARAGGAAQRDFGKAVWYM